MKRILAAVLTLCLLLSLTACGKKTSGKIPGGTDAPKEEPAQPGSEPACGDAPEKEPAEEPVPDEAAQAVLELLRMCMESPRQAAAVAYLGYRDAAEQDGDLTDWLWTNVPGLMEEMAFLQTIPSDRVLNGGYGDLYCIVLRDEHASLAVNHVVWRSNQRGVWPVAEEVLYRSEYAEPLLLFVRWEEFQDEPDVEIVIVSDGGVEVSWCPTRNIEDGSYIELPSGVDYEPLLMDFSSFGDVTGLDYEGNLWASPTALGLANTVWNCGSWMLELRLGGGDPDYAGVAQLSYQQEDGQEYQTAYSGVWRMENDCLQLELSAGVGTSLSGSFPVYIDLSGEHLMLHRDGATHAGLPFFADDANYMELTLSYG